MKTSHGQNLLEMVKNYPKKRAVSNSPLHVEVIPTMV